MIDYNVMPVCLMVAADTGKGCRNRLS